MASARIKKKQMKGLLKIQLQQSIEGLSAINQGIDDIDEQIRKARQTLEKKKKKATFEELQNQLTKTESYRQSILNILYSKSEPYVKKGKRYEDKGSTITNDGIYGAVLKKYYEYIDKGWIDRVSTLDKYEAAQWFAENILSQRGMEDAIEQADRWREEEEVKHQRSLQARAKQIGF